jgi:hypothetical protein
MEPLGHGAIRFLHRGDLREHVAFPVRLVLFRARAEARFRLQLLGALLHRGSFLVRESLGLLVVRGGALGGLLRALLCGFPLSHCEAPPPDGSALLLDADQVARGIAEGAVATKRGSGFAPSDEHYVVFIGSEAIDATARQFDQAGDPITRRSLKEVSAPWRVAQPVRIGYAAPLIGRDLHDIPANWAQLADVDPPGDAIGWPYPGPWPTDRRSA